MTQSTALYVVFAGRAEGIYDRGGRVTAGGVVLGIAGDGESVTLAADAALVADGQFQFTLDYDSRLLVGMAVSRHGTVGLKRGAGEYHAFSPDQ